MLQSGLLFTPNHLEVASHGPAIKGVTFDFCRFVVLTLESEARILSSVACFTVAMRSPWPCLALLGASYKQR